MTITLDWYPLQHFSKLDEVDVLHMESNRSGIYIWGFKDDDEKFWPYYVGKHRNVPFRLCEHLSNLKGGNYTIYAKNKLFTLEDEPFYRPHIIKDRCTLLKLLEHFEVKTYTQHLF